MIGIVYHVIDKSTNQCVRVGSTIQGLQTRWYKYNKKKFSNHRLEEHQRIESSEEDLFIKGDPLCPFVWHLIAAEHLEILRMGTFRVGPLSNHQSPLDQKLFGFDPAVAGKIGGAITLSRGGAKYLEKARTKEHQRRAGRLGCLASKNKRTAIFAPGFAQKNGRLYGSAGGKRCWELHPDKTPFRLSKAQPLGNHTRWHVNRGIIKPGCKFCEEKA
jgi:hypothetical protein